MHVRLRLDRFLFWLNANTFVFSSFYLLLSFGLIRAPVPAS